MENQENFVAILIYGIVFIILLTTGLMLFFHYSRKKLLQKEVEKIGLKVKYKDELLQSTIATQEEERTRIAQDLHDDISAKLNIVSLTTHSLLENLSLSKEDRASLEHVLNVTTSTLESSRRISHDLLPPVLDKFGLQVALEELFEDFEKTNSMQMLYAIKISKTHLTSNEELHIFRIVQELINNATRHGDANQIKFELYDTKDGFELSCEDNGKGFLLKSVEQKIGLGLQNIKSRTAILNCKLEMNSTLGKGSVFKISSLLGKDGVR